MNKRLSSILKSAFLLSLCLLIVWRLPVNGWGSLVWLAGNIIMAIIRKPHIETNADNIISQSYQTVTEKLLLVIVVVGSLLLPLLQLGFGLLSVANYALPIWAHIVGIFFLAIGLWLFYRSHADLGRNWSVTLEIRKGHHLVDSGVYRRIRHPMYAAIFLIFAAQLLLIQNYIAAAGGIISFTLMYIIRVPKEEAVMREHFGEHYIAYCRRTGRMLPKFIA